MAIRRRRVEDAEETEINITPMMDIVFIMLIFFIVTSTFVKEPGVDIMRPEANTADAKPQGNILVAIDGNGEIWVDNNPVESAALRSKIERLRNENPKGTMVIQADQESRNKELIMVMDAAREAGITKVSISAEKR